MTTPSETTKEQVPPPAASKGSSGRMWQSDPVFQDIRNAFILGWSLVELRSRIQVAALDDSKLPASARSSRASGNTADPMQLVKGTNDRLLRASRLRTIFNTIVSLQLSMFPTSVTIDTLYDPPSQMDLPYLYPPAPDYANIGINPLKDADGNLVWTDFRLFEVTRRAINCLTLLLVTPQDSLIPAQVEQQQARLADWILKVAEEECQDEEDDTASARSLTAAAISSYKRYEKSIGEVASTETATKHAKAITTLSHFTSRMLEAWDGYLRERISAEGVDANNLVTLLAFEAGRNLGTISWNTSVNAIILENQPGEKKNLNGDLYQVWRKTFTDSGLVQVLHQITALSTVLDDAYYRNADKPAALKTESTQDDLLLRPDPARPSDVLQAVRQSIEYWQRTVLWLGLPVAGSVPVQGGAQQTNKDVFDLGDWQRLRNALIEQSGIWFNLMTGQQDLRGFTVESITQQLLDDALNQFRKIAAEDLPAAAQQAVDVLETATESVVEVGKTATRVAANGVKQLFGSVNRTLLILIVVGVVLGVAAIGYMFYAQATTGKADGLIALITSAVTAVGGFLGMKRGESAKAKSEDDIKQEIDKVTEAKTGEIQKSKEDVKTALGGGIGMAGMVGGALGQAGSYLLQAYDNGLQRIQIELQSLNYSVAVTHPLIEYFIRHEGIDVHEDFQFLTTVIWSSANREAQLRRVITAAFGPISILLTPPSEKQPDNGQAGTVSGETVNQPFDLEPEPVG